MIQEMIFFHELIYNQLSFFNNDLVNSLEEALKAISQFRRHAV